MPAICRRTRSARAADAHAAATREAYAAVVQKGLQEANEAKAEVVKVAGETAVKALASAKAAKAGMRAALALTYLPLICLRPASCPL